MVLAAQTVLQDRYRIVTLLGQGGMGAVYRAWDLRLEVPVALKEQIPQPDLDAGMLAQLRQQFKQEAVTLARLSHPNLVKVMDFFDEGGSVYLVMEFLEGESLADRVARDGHLPEAQVLSWAQQLLDALAYCHSQGIVHRDIKPQNIVLRPDGRAVLVDFGLVKLWNPNDPQTRTVMRGMGTPEYAPPEQYGRQGQSTDPRSDLYSLGATLYHALTGQAPPTASDRMAYPELFKPVRALNPRVSVPTEIGILRALEPAANQRWAQASDMAAALRCETVPRHPTAPPVQPNVARAWNSGTVVMPKTPSPAPASVTRRIPSWAWVVGAVVGLAALAVAWNALGGLSRATPTVAVTDAVTQTPGVTVTRPLEPTPTFTPEPAPSATPAPELKLGATRTREADGMVMVYVPAGEFQMGSTQYDDEQPVHTVALDGFWLDRTEVSNAQYAAFLSATGNQSEGGATWLDSTDEDCLIEQVGNTFRPKSGYAQHPVIEVTWYGAATYCEWAGGRLPTEAEWEYAARGPEGLTYPWGNTFDGTRLNFCEKNCNYDWADKSVDDGYKFTAPVGSYP
ncbi:MAG: SUMF1/EgtB/PvdO family nonheme iron enzyme, partial [Anaerolineae bacterium]|nr:SUMF1/EgtB/PvdO family nonheme iron enzyme [Anaerolineae bacterium]